MSTSQEGRPAGNALRRREFLALGSAGVASLCFGDLAWAQDSVSAEATARPLPVGYLEGSETLPKLRRLPLQVRRPRAAVAEAAAIRIVPADALPMGNTDLIGRPLRMTIHGLYPPGVLLAKGRRELPLAVDLDVLFPSPDPMFPAPLRFFAWSFRRRPGWNPSPPVSFVFPLDWHALPEFTLRVVPASGPARRFHTRFTFDEETGRPRLLRGAYLLGTAPNAWMTEVALSQLGPNTPASLASILLSMEPEGEL
jgi:hypothetical protein